MKAQMLLSAVCAVFFATASFAATSKAPWIVEGKDGKQMPVYAAKGNQKYLVKFEVDENNKPVAGSKATFDDSMSEDNDASKHALYLHDGKKFIPFDSFLKSVQADIQQASDDRKSATAKTLSSNIDEGKLTQVGFFFRRRFAYRGFYGGYGYGGYYRPYVGIRYGVYGYRGFYGGGYCAPVYYRQVVVTPYYAFGGCFC